MYPLNHKKGQIIKTDATGVAVDRAFLAHYKVAAADAVAAAVAGVHAAKACPAINVAATGVVKAASAVTDILTITSTVALGATANDLNVLLTTAAGDTLAVTKTDGTKTINIALANTTANKNTASNIQTAIQALSTVGGIDVSAFTCAAGGNWDTAAKATGETGSVDFSGGLSPIDVITTDLTSPAVPRNVTATTDGTAADIKAVQVIVTGTNFSDEVVTETLPIFTVNEKTTVAGTKAFKTITSVSIPAHDGLAATTSIGWGSIFGLPYKLYADELAILKLFNKAVDAATVVVNETYIENNTFALAGTPDGAKDIDLYLIV